MHEDQQQTGQQEVEKLFQGVVRLNATVLAFTLGLLCGVLIFVATLWLVIKGGDPVGPHLSLLSQYFIGYQVTLGGSFVGFFYGFVVGGVAGAIIGWVYNKIATLRG